jgi:hypothetical protein
MRLPIGRRLTVLALAGLLVCGWLVINRPGRFGPSCYGYISYNALPRPVMDFQVRSNGATRRVPKTHDLGVDQIQWLLDPPPDVLIICKGWSSVVQVRDEVLNLPGRDVRIIPTGAGLELFNELRSAGRSVAIHVHSTC